MQQRSKWPNAIVGDTEAPKKAVVHVDPFRCRMWALHDRLEHHIDELTCKAEIESVQKHGQLVATLGRPLQGDPEHDLELIFGARRLFVARHLNRPLMVEVRTMTDSEAVIAMDIENRHRLDISPYERGMSYLRWLRSGFFKSQDDIARALKISPSQVSRLIKLAQLPTAVVGAFQSPMDLCENWALSLAEIVEDSERRKATCMRARAIATGGTRPPPREIYRQLLTASVPGPKSRPPRHDEVVPGRNGKPLYRIRHQTDTIVLILPIENMSSASLSAIRNVVTTVLLQEKANPQQLLPPRHELAAATP